MPDHIKFMLRHAMIGGGIAAIFVAGLMVFNVGNLPHLVSHSPGGWLALTVLFVLCWITFGSVQIGLRIMGMGEGSDGE